MAAFNYRRLLGLARAAGESDFFHLDMHVRSPLVWWSIGVTALALLSCLWDAEAGTWGLPFAPLYALGLAAGSLAIHQWALPPRDLAWGLSLGLACYVFSASSLVQLSPRFAFLMRPLQITPRSQGWLAGWFVPSQEALVALADAAPLCFWTMPGFSGACRTPGRPFGAYAGGGDGLAHDPELARGLSGASFPVEKRSRSCAGHPGVVDTHGCGELVGACSMPLWPLPGSIAMCCCSRRWCSWVRCIDSDLAGR